MDIFRDYFTRENLVRSLSQAPYTPGLLGALGIFETVPLTSTTLAVEVSAKDSGRILTAIPRGAPRQRNSLDKRSVKTFQTETFGDQIDVSADEVLNSRGAGTQGQAEVIQDRRDRAVSKLRLTADLTHENLRMQCLLNPDTTEFGSAPSPVVIAVQTSTTKMRKEIFNKIIKVMEGALDGVPYTRAHVLCSDGYWEDLIENEAINKTYLNWQAAAELRGDTTERFVFGNVMWERYRGTSAVKIADNEAVAFPVGAQGLFMQGFAPNDTMESVGEGALGQPYYLGAMPIKDSQGTKAMEISIQTHPKMVCGRPAAIQRITKA